LVNQAALDGDVVAHTLLTNAAQQLATLASAVRGQLFEKGETASVAYIGGVYRSGLVLERFRLLVELEEGNSVIAPCYGPAAGALIEALRAARLHVTLKNLPEFEK
jgi:N-acetylglucosamine kinase-like BadF-type ATPase